MEKKRMEQHFLVRGDPEDVLELLTVKEVAAILRVPVSWVYGHTRRRSLDALPYVKVGKYLRFLPDEIREYVRRLRARCDNHG